MVSSDHKAHQHGASYCGGGKEAGDTALAVDLVCGMKVDPAATKHHANHSGQDYHFCSAGCRAKFIASPEHYLAKATASPTAGLSDVIHTCPMHPEVRQVGPGSCPICGMALEPETVSADHGPNPELVYMTSRFFFVSIVSFKFFNNFTKAHFSLILNTHIEIT